MTTYTAIADADIDPESPGTTTLFTRLRDNPIAITEKASGAPVLANDYIVQDMVSASTIGQAELKTTNSAISTSSDALMTLPGGQYGFYPQIKASDGTAQYGATIGGAASNTAPGTSYATRIVLRAVGGGSIFAQQRYIQASPPYDLGDGEISRFVFVEVHKSTGDVISVYSAQEAPWHYNGPTDIRGKALQDIHGQIVKARGRKDMSGMITFEEAMSDNAGLQEYMDAFKEAPMIYEEITQEIKNKDMQEIPRPMEPKTDTEIILLDPVCNNMGKLAEMCEAHDEFNLNQLLHDGRFNINNTVLSRATPPGVTAHSFKLK